MFCSAARGALALLCLQLVVATGCKNDDSSSSKKPATPETPAVPDEAPAPPNVDVTFLVEGCEGAGFSAEQCKCAGELAKSRLSAGLIAKMSEAPADDDPKLADYYTTAEINTTMAWVDESSSKCGIEEVD